jgi:hypothetical protein
VLDSKHKNSLKILRKEKQERILSGFQKKIQVVLRAVF